MTPFVLMYPASMGCLNWCYQIVISGVLSGLIPMSGRCQPLSLRLIIVQIIYLEASASFRVSRYRQY